MHKNEWRPNKRLQQSRLALASLVLAIDNFFAIPVVAVAVEPLIYSVAIAGDFPASNDLAVAPLFFHRVKR